MKGLDAFALTIEVLGVIGMAIFIVMEIQTSANIYLVLGTASGFLTMFGALIWAKGRNRR